MPKAPGRHTGLVGSQAAPSGHTGALGWPGGAPGAVWSEISLAPTPQLSVWASLPPRRGAVFCDPSSGAIPASFLTRQVKAALSSPEAHFLLRQGHLGPGHPSTTAPEGGRARDPKLCPEGVVHVADRELEASN